MLIIEQIYEPKNVRSDFVKCPACKRGRLCDKPVGDQVMAIAISESPSSGKGNRIILKCPSCARKFIITISKE